MDESAKMR
jgi:hypothetical protein